MNVFSYRSYKEFLRDYIQENEYRGLISNLAEAIGCDRTYLSQVLNGKADLTPDHLIRLSNHLGLDETESRYLMLVLLFDRSSSQVAKSAFQAQLEKLRSDALALTNKISRKEKVAEMPEEFRTRYYSNWIYAAVHILTSIPDFQTTQALSDKLQLSPSQIHKVLRDLVEMHLVRKEKDKFVHASSDIYLPRENAQTFNHHMSWRMKAVERSYEKEDVHYTNVFSISKKDWEVLRDQIVELIDRQRKQVQSSGTEVACAFSCDFFKI